jgi:methyl-accepting chemotaxis protein
MSTNNAAFTEETSAMAEDLTDIVATSTKQMNQLSEEFETLSSSINNFTFK